MIITAHGGAMGTKRNSPQYFDTVKKYRVDSIEVDIHIRGEVLYLAHILPKIFLKNAIKLETVFEYCKANDVMVNCDMKKSGMTAPICALANEMNAGKFIYFTGTFMPSEAADLTEGIAYVNDCFYQKACGAFTEGNVEKIKAYLDSFGNPRIKGVNLNYENVTDAAINKAKEIGLGLSIYTVDDPKALEKFVMLEPDNITTNIADVALKLAGRL